MSLASVAKKIIMSSKCQ